jgi:hypothetical protein
MKNPNRNQIRSARRLLSSVTTLLASLLAVMPALAQDNCQAELENTSVPTSDLGCFKTKDGLREAIRLAQVTRRPLLTEQNLNSIIPTNSRDSRFANVATEAKQDLKAFIKGRFTLTPEQLRQLNTLSTRDIAKIQAAINQAQQKGAPLSVKIQPASSGSTAGGALGVRVQNIEQPTQQSDQARIRIVIEIDKP